MPATLIAGAVSGMVGLIVFLTIHHFLIQPIWFILPIGAVLAGLGWLAVGWAYELLRPQLPGGLWTIPALVGLILFILLPALIMTFDRPRRKKGGRLPIDSFDPTFYGESEDEEIDLSKIRIHNRHPSAE